MQEVEIYDMDAEPSLIARFFDNDLLMYRSVMSRDEAVHFAKKILEVLTWKSQIEQQKIKLWQWIMLIGKILKIAQKNSKTTKRL